MKPLALWSLIHGKRSPVRQTMSMNEFRQLAAKIDQHMQRLAAEGVNDASATINRMEGYMPDFPLATGTQN